MGARCNVGDCFGRLVVLGFTRTAKLFSGRKGVYCQCDCGNLVCTLVQSLRRGATKSCGCYGAFMRNQGKRYLECDSSMKNRSKVYVRWFNMMHSRQGVVPAWEDYIAFRTWWFDQGYDDGPRMYMKPIDKHKPYGPDNVRVRKMLSKSPSRKPAWKTPDVLKNAICAAHSNGESTRSIKERFCVSRNTVCSIIATKETTGK